MWSKIKAIFTPKPAIIGYQPKPGNIGLPPTGHSAGAEKIMRANVYAAKVERQKVVEREQREREKELWHKFAQAALCGLMSDECIAPTSIPERAVWSAYAADAMLEETRKRGLL